MAGNRPGDWHVLDLDKDPTPGDPDRVRHLAKNLHDFADDVGDALRLIKGMADEDAVLQWAGKSAKAFQDEFSGVPKQLKKLKKSYEMAGDALAAYWPKLERAQALADKALAKGREAQSDLSSAKSRLSSADSWVTKANKEADKYKDDPTGSKDAEKPDEAKVRAATRDAQHAKSAHTKAQSDVTNANSALDAAKKMAEDARKMREEAAKEAKQKIDDASDAGIHNRKWWEEVGDWFSDNWDTIVAVCKVVVAVVGVIAMIIGGPILAAIVVVAALVVLADTLNKYRKGQASLLDVAFAAMDCIPGGKGITSLGKLAKGMKGLGKMGLKGMAKGLGKGLRREARQADEAVAKSKPAKGRCEGGDPIDMVSGEMFMEQTDVALPGLLALILRRTHLSTYASGQWFGPSWASTLDERLELDSEGALFATEDGMILAYPVPAPGTSVLPVEGPRWPLDWDGSPGAPIRVTDPQTGHTRHFAPVSEPLSADQPFMLPLAAVSDRNGHRIDIDRDEYGAPTAVRHSGGYHVHVDTRSGRVIRLRLRDPQAGSEGTTLIDYGYTDGNLTEIYNSSGLPYRLTYDDRARITSWTDRNGFWYRYTYDSHDRCIRGEGADGVLNCTVAYDTDVRETRFTNSLGHTTLHRYNELLQRTEITDALGRTVRTEWDPYNRQISRTDALGQRTSFEHDARGNLAAITRPDGRRTTMEYDELDLPIQVVEADGAVWQQTFDARGNRRSITDPTGNTRHCAYDEQGRPTSMVDALGHVTRTVCDPAGLSIAETDALGHTTRAERDAFGRIVRVIDAEGNVEHMGWTVEGAPAWRMAADGSRESWEWDGEGHLTAHTDRAGNRSTTKTGHFHQPAARTDRTGAEHRFTYDTEVNLTKVTSPQGLTWDYVYDETNRLICETDFEGRTLTYAYDGAGRLTSRTNGAGEEVALTRNELGRVVEERSAHGVAVFAHDPMGRLLRAVNEESLLERAYDAAGRLLRESIDGAETSYTYDALGRRTERRTPSGIVSTWTYDAVGRPETLSAAGHRMAFTYDALGRELSRGLGAAASLTQTWDAMGRLAGQSIHGGGPRADIPVQQREFSYRADGLLSGIDELTTGRRVFDMDRDGRVTAVRGRDWTETYAYDGLGNLLESSVPAVGQDSGIKEYRGNRLLRSGRTTYEYDRQGRPVRTVKRLLNGQRRVATFSWDAEDRLTVIGTPEGAKWRYRYDPAGRRCGKARLASDGSVVEEIRFTWDGTRVAEQVDHDGHATTWDYFSGTHRPLTQLDHRMSAGAAAEDPQNRGTAVRFHAVVTDTVGTPTELVNDQGELAWHQRTELWGTALQSVPPAVDSTAAVDCPLRFPGQYADPETGWNYNYARYYDPENARYLTPDPLGLSPSPNHYGYVSHPFFFTDPLGLIRNPATGRYAVDPNAPATRRNRSSEYPHGYWDSTHEDMVTRFTDEGRAAGGWPVDRNGARIPRDQLTWRNNAGEIIPGDSTILTYDHNPRVVEHYNQTGYNSSYADRETWYNDTTDMEPMTRADNGRDGQRAPQYRQDIGPNYSCRGA
ncbi:DUF6531 domain-containing protein [Streptomyces sp. NPDC048415]|uniref:DUF6531 domain-containing protein n=1 Tax=Streptomyces sp. NPDC048415 TaxID=3154822 RepID=UPI003444FE7F